jgi:hypothetical protein
MHLEKPIPKNRFAVDFVAYDKAGKPILFGWTSSREVSPEAIDHLIACLDASRSQIPFAMLADPEQLSLYRKHADGTAELVWTARSADVLTHYDPEFGRSPRRLWPEPKPGSILDRASSELDRVRISPGYLRTLIEAWLRDIAYHWMSSAPPAKDEMASLGLLCRLEGGTTRSEVWLAGNPLS